MRTPDFWRDARDPRAKILLPVSVLFGAIAAQRLKRRAPSLDRPSILIGNFTAGGAGKTPTVLALAALLKKSGETPAIIARGYGGSAGHSAPMRAIGQDYRIFGDEALLLARAAPTYIGVDRLRAARLAIEEIHPSIILFDDGLQSRRIEPALAFAVVDGALGLGNGYCLPAGPLRAPLARQWPLISALIVIGAGNAGQALAQEALTRGKAVFFAKTELRSMETENEETGMDVSSNKDISSLNLKNERFVAFAGIGYPEKFFSALKNQGANLVKMRAFPDHHPYTVREITQLHRQAKQCAARLITTEKDFVRLPEKVKSDTDLIQAVAAALTFQDEHEMQHFLTRNVSAGHGL